MILQAAKQFAHQENAIERTRQSLDQMQLIRTHMGYQQSVLAEHAANLDYIKEQVNAMER